MMKQQYHFSYADSTGFNMLAYSASLDLFIQKYTPGGVAMLVYTSPPHKNRG